MIFNLQFYKYDGEGYFLRSCKKSLSLEPLFNSPTIDFFETYCCEEIMLVVEFQPTQTPIIVLDLELLEEGELETCNLHCEPDLMMSCTQPTLEITNKLFRAFFALHKPFQCPCLSVLCVIVSDPTTGCSYSRYVTFRVR
jgi:hypothetical protein